MPSEKGRSSEDDALRTTITLKQMAAELAGDHHLLNTQAEALLDDLMTVAIRHLKDGTRVRLTGQSRGTIEGVLPDGHGSSGGTMSSRRHFREVRAIHNLFRRILVVLRHRFALRCRKFSADYCANMCQLVTGTGEFSRHHASFHFIVVLVDHRR